MKKIQYGLSVCLMLLAFNVSAFDVVTYKKIANDTIKQMKYGVAGDIDTIVAMQEQLITLAVEGSELYLEEDQEDFQALAIVVDNVDDMKDLSLEEIEDQWHRGGYLKDKGIDIEEIDHFSETNSLMDSIIHPITAYLLMKEYKVTGDASYLARVKDELFEVLEHIKHVKQAEHMSTM